jgi:nitroimidazol reductase NimA-like FMN-containing flavoprotein (pyridoxamine 5'-phosphate oxidase superfamily)
MFRDMRRRKQGLPEDEITRILTEQKRGVLSVHGEDGYPYGLPMNFLYDPAEGRIYVHSAKAGHKIDAITADNRVCFTTWDDGVLDEDEWSYHVKSVVAFGRAELVQDERTTYEKARALGEKYFPTEEYVDDEMRKAASRVQMIAITIDHVTGKSVHEQ